jgi:hypothetical protein
LKVCADSVTRPGGFVTRGFDVGMGSTLLEGREVGASED